MNTISTKGFTEMTNNEMITTDGGCSVCRTIGKIGRWIRDHIVHR